jgi:hypothetical protein
VELRDLEATASALQARCDQSQRDLPPEEEVQRQARQTPPSNAVHYAGHRAAKERKRAALQAAARAAAEAVAQKRAEPPKWGEMPEQAPGELHDAVEDAGDALRWADDAGAVARAALNAAREAHCLALHEAPQQPGGGQAPAAPQPHLRRMALLHDAIAVARCAADLSARCASRARAAVRFAGGRRRIGRAKAQQSCAELRADLELLRGPLCSRHRSHTQMRR